MHYKNKFPGPRAPYMTKNYMAIAHNVDCPRHVSDVDGMRRYTSIF